MKKINAEKDAELKELYKKDITMQDPEKQHWDLQAHATPKFMFDFAYLFKRFDYKIKCAISIHKVFCLFSFNFQSNIVNINKNKHWMVIAFMRREGY